MKIETKAVHAGDRKKAGEQHPVHDADLYRVHVTSTRRWNSWTGFRPGDRGESYSRYSNPTNAALEELVTCAEERRRRAGVRPPA